MAAKETWQPAAADVASIDAIVAALYDAVSFKPGASPDWKRFEALFHPDGRLVPPRTPGVEVEDRGEAADTERLLPALDVVEFAENSSRFIEESGIRARGFHEREVGRRVERFGAVAHVMSAYESRFADGDADPIARGVNTIQLLHDRGRWWILGVVWATEDEDHPIPEDYLTP
ncbi:MAG: hypothetical protein ACODAA_06940 [Gemmatimonadota bacterium]